MRSISAVAMLAVATGLLGGATVPAGAEPPSTTFSSPGEDEVVATTPVISGEVRMAQGVLVEDVRIEVVSKWDYPGASTVVPATALPSQAFTFSPSLAYNGPYQAIVTSTGKDMSLDVRTDTAVASRNFSLAVPPVAPSGLEVAVDPDTREVAVTWQANPEPDILGYQLRRSTASGDKRLLVGITRDTALVDRGTASLGGDYRYELIAVRVGSSADSAVSSPASVTDVVVVPDPPPGTPAGDPLVVSAAPVSEAGRVDASLFRRLVRRAEGSAGRSLAEPEAAFDPVLPARGLSREPSPMSVREAGDSDGRRSLNFVAAGLLAFVLLLQVRWVMAQVDRAPPLQDAVD